MDYKEKYNKLVEAVKVLQKTNPSDEGIQNWINDNVPELRESEDEQIIKALAEGIRAIERCGWSDFGGIPIEDVLDWLEKQGQVKESSIPQHENKTCEENSNSLTSEDERIRKSLITFFQRFPYDSIEKAGTSAKDAIAWLEKQCKPIDEEKVLIGARKGVALSIINYLDNNSVGMCLSSIECEDIEDACVNSKWIKLYNYMKKKLEKQGSPVLSNSSNVVKDVECSADRIVPKFKVGDWVVFANGNVGRITSAGTHGYTFDDGDYLLHENCDKQAHLWTIADAREGDVLCCESDWTCIFKTLVNDETFSSYCFMDKTKWFCETGSECHTLNKEFTKAYSGEIKPATKEQRDLLFQKMRDAGYEWNSEKKELKKIKPKFKVKYAGSKYNVFKTKDIAGVTFYGIEDEPNHIDYVKAEDCEIISGYGIKEKGSPHPTKPAKFSEQKPAWSEEDEERITNTLSVLSVQVCWDGATGEKKNPYQKEIDWLKSLQQRLGGEE